MKPIITALEGDLSQDGPVMGPLCSGGTSAARMLLLGVCIRLLRFWNSHVSSTRSSGAAPAWHAVCVVEWAVVSLRPAGLEACVDDDGTSRQGLHYPVNLVYGLPHEWCVMAYLSCPRA